MAVLGLICGAGVSDDSATGCLTGGIGSGIENGVVAGLAHWPPPPNCAQALELRPFLAAR